MTSGREELRRRRRGEVARVPARRESKGVPVSVLGMWEGISPIMRSSVSLHGRGKLPSERRPTRGLIRARSAGRPSDDWLC